MDFLDRSDVKYLGAGLSDVGRRRRHGGTCMECQCESIALAFYIF